MAHQHPSIQTLSIEGNFDEGVKHIGAAQKVVDQLQQRLALGGIQSGADWKDLGDGAWLYARVAMGVNAVRIVVPPVPKPLREAVEQIDLGPPDFLSGIVSPGYIVERTVTDGINSGGQPVKRTINLLKDYWPTLAAQRKHNLVEGWQESERLAVLDDPLLSVQVVPLGMNSSQSQHFGIKPSMYSGTMKKVVQLLLGYGRQNQELYRYELWDVPADSGSAKPKKVTIEDRVRYDFRAYRTHGIAFSPDNKPWLIEVSSHNGVVGMPLELHPRTTGEAFMRHLERTGDDEAMHVVSMLGGFPTGRTFPASSVAMRALISAGIAVQMATADDLKPFYNNNPYSSAMGWAFNELGTEAHNTCFNWDEATDYQYGEHYAISVRIGGNHEVPVPKQAGDLAMHIGRVSQDGWPSGEREAFGYYRRKIGRLSDDAVDSLLRMPPAQAYQALKDISVDPVTEASAMLTRCSRGHLMNQGYDTEYQAKFWEPLMKNAVISHDFSSLGELLDRPPRGPAPSVCDTAMLVFFAGNALKTVKWFWDTRRKAINKIESDEEDCMYVGKWTYTQETGTVGPAPGYYSADYDYRTEHPDATYKRVTEGKDLGWIRVEADWPPGWPLGNFSEARRYRGFRMTTETRTGISQESACSMVWPAFAREAYYLAERVRRITDGHALGYSYREMQDPNHAALAIADSGPAGILTDPIRHCGNPGKRRVYEFFRIGGDLAGCTSLIDEGPWASECEPIDPYVFNTPLPPLPPGFSKPQILEIEYRGHFVSGYGDAVDLEAESDLWFEPSPPRDSPDAYQFMHATGNCLGDTECVIYSEIPNGGLARAGGPDLQELTEAVPCFIGVV